MKIWGNLCIKQILSLNKVEETLFKLIKLGGPQTVATLMRIGLSLGAEGYYMKKDVFGAKGDFITSPEISQMFGELLGLWIVNEWISQKCVKPLQLVELGPGRGTLMGDALKAISKFPDLISNIKVSFVEISPELKSIQEKTIQKFCNSSIPGVHVPVTWFHSLDQVPRDICTAFIANEFFDALPIHKFQRNASGKWREVLVDLLRVDDGDSMELGFIVSKKETSATVAFSDILEKVTHLDEFEISPLSGTIIEDVGERILECGGFALISDYGHSGEKGDTFRAFKSHQISNPLTDLGECDLTADVNFDLLVTRLTSRFPDQLMISGPVWQSYFLKNMGIDVRLQRLLNVCTTQAEVDHLISGYKLMMNADEMGHRFKFLSILPASKTYPKDYVPAGFCSL